MQPMQKLIERVGPLRLLVVLLIVCVSLATAWHYQSRYWPADLEAKLQALPAIGSYQPAFRNPVSAKPGPNSKPIYHLRLLPSETRTSKDLSILSAVNVSRYLDAFDATDCTDFDDSCLKRLLGADSLRFLSLERTSITDAAIDDIAKHFPNLVMLDIENTAVTIDGVKRIVRENRIRFIDVILTESECVEVKKFAAEYSPKVIIRVGTNDIMDQPESVYGALPVPL